MEQINLIYGKTTGRFTSVDTLFEAFKRRSPYAYSYNSPLTFRYLQAIGT